MSVVSVEELIVFARVIASSPHSEALLERTVAALLVAGMYQRIVREPQRSDDCESDDETEDCDEDPVFRHLQPMLAIIMQEAYHWLTQNISFTSFLCQLFPRCSVKKLQG